MTGSRIILFLLIQTLCCLIIRGQQHFYFEHLTVNEGLSQNTVNRVFKDSQGFIWVATNDGLNRYDGYSFSTYRFRFGDSTSISNNRIEDICEDSEGNLWVGTRGGLNRYDREKDQFERISIHDPGEGSNKYNFVRTLLCDRNGDLWVGTMGGGLHLIASGEREIVRLNPSTTGPPENILSDTDISDIYEDRQGRIWVATNTDGINLYDRAVNRFIYHPLNGPESEIPLEFGKTLYQDSEGLIWICTLGGGIHSLDPETMETRWFHTNDPGRSLKSDIVKDVLEYQGNLWIATDGGGVHIFDKESGIFSYLRLDPLDPGSLNTQAIYSLFKDDQDILWVGTFNGGINKYDPRLRKFEHYSSLPGRSNGLSHPYVLCFEEENEGRVLIGTDGGGVNLFDPETGTFGHFFNGTDRSLHSHVVTSMLRDSRDRLWIGTYSGGLHQVSEGMDVVASYRSRADDPLSLINDNVWAVCEDSTGTFWIGTSEGLQRFCPDEGSFQLIPNEIRSTVRFQERITYIYPDRRGKLWFCGAELFILNQGKDSLVTCPFSAGIRQQIADADFRSVYQDTQFRYWICTEGSGLLFMDPRTDSTRIITVSDGLPSNSLHRVLEDSAGNLWISSNDGLCRYSPGTGEFMNYDLSDGMQSNQYSYSAALAASDGTLYFGGVNGFNRFHPLKITRNDFVPPVVMTNLLIFNNPVKAGGKNSPLDSHISETSEITLKHSQSVVTFEFAALNYTAPDRNQYQIMMEGFENDWRDIGTQRSATYTNLDAGRYLFRVKASNNDLIWNQEGLALQIRVLPPWWRSWYAYLAYAVLIVLILMFYRRTFLKEARLKHELEVKELENQRIEELNNMELRFFTNISHEFKTPLTLIQGPLEQIISRGPHGEQLDRHLSMMRANVGRLLRLINQLMEFRKVKQSTLALKVRQGDLIGFLRDIKSVFDELAEARGIEYRFRSELTSKAVWFDPDKIEKIVFNLLSNAFRNTSGGGRIELSVSLENRPEDCLQEGPPEKGSLSECILVSVEDTGTGIPGEKLAHIFDRFYQVEPEGKYRPTSEKGTGIGLSLTRALVEAHHGRIVAESTPGKGSCFSFAIPLSPEQYSETETELDHSGEQPSVTLRPAEEDATGTDDGRKSGPDGTGSTRGLLPPVLVVEDEAEVRDFIAGILFKDFHVFTAADGEEALRRVLADPPEMVITDVMMPVMDGLELTNRLKTGASTSHIPVIMLTARGEEGDIIRGLKEGADDYITKPFCPGELVQKLRNITGTRQRMWEKFNQQIPVEPSEITVTSFDERFMASALRIVEEHIDDPEFDVSALVHEVGMSRSVLYRKLKALTGQSAKEFINTIRLKRAAQLLSKKKLSISEITYMVGYNDPQYFSKCFKKQFGQTPSQYASGSSAVKEVP